MLMKYGKCYKFFTVSKRCSMNPSYGGQNPDEGQEDIQLHVFPLPPKKFLDSTAKYLEGNSNSGLI
jgi:hypothetical protein